MLACCYGYIFSYFLAKALIFNIQLALYFMFIYTKFHDDRTVMKRVTAYPASCARFALVVSHALCNALVINSIQN